MRQNDRTILQITLFISAGVVLLGAALIIVIVTSGKRKKEVQPAAEQQTAQVSTVFVDGTRGMSALPVTCAPCGICACEDGAVLVTDTHAKCVWRVTDSGAAVYAGGESPSDLYGTPVGGYYDAVVEESLFREPWAIAPFLDGYAVSDPENHVVRIIHNSQTETLGGNASDLPVSLIRPTGLAVDENGNLFVSDTGAGEIWGVTEEGRATQVMSGLAEPTALCYADGVLYIAETGANRILKVEDGEQQVLAGSGESGSADGEALKASFSSPQGIAVAPDGTVLVSDTTNASIRRISGGQVTTIFQQKPDRLESWPVSPMGLLLTGKELYVCDRFSRIVYILDLQ